MFDVMKSMIESKAMGIVWVNYGIPGNDPPGRHGIILVRSREMDVIEQKLGSIAREPGTRLVIAHRMADAFRAAFIGRARYPEKAIAFKRHFALLRAVAGENGIVIATGWERDAVLGTGMKHPVPRVALLVDAKQLALKGRNREELSLVPLVES
jgi:hypothetical protein